MGVLEQIRYRWNSKTDDTLSEFLLEHNFRKEKIDTTLFLQKEKDHSLIVQIYVDDIILESSNPKLCEEFVKLMTEKFEMSMIGELTYFLGIEVKQMKDGIFINQAKYTWDLIKKFGMQNSTPVKTPMPVSAMLDPDINGESVNVTEYRGMIGSLLYLTASCPDIMFATCICARYQANPKESHMLHVKRILRYLKGTVNLGL